MGILTEEMKRVVREQRLGFVATVCPDGTPNLSPKGTTAVWDDDRLVFAGVRSPGTVRNLRSNPPSRSTSWTGLSARATASKARPPCSPKARGSRRSSPSTTAWGSSTRPAASAPSSWYTSSRPSP